MFKRFTTKHLIKSIERVDLYSNKQLLNNQKTIEHVIPKSCFQGVKAYDNLFNMCVTTLHINGKRSNYRYSDLELTNCKEKIPIIENKEIVAYYNKEKRLFFPLENKGRIARISYYMLLKYPFLGESQVFENPYILRNWILEPMDMNECFAIRNKMNNLHFVKK